MNWKTIMIGLLVLVNAYKLLLHIVRYRSAGNPTPANVADVYDDETYQRWKAYSAEKCRLHIVSLRCSSISYCVSKKVTIGL